jgi:DNA-directed RNA polymerase specialized sigma24 family protein
MERHDRKPEFSSQQFVATFGNNEVRFLESLEPEMIRKPLSSISTLEITCLYAQGLSANEIAARLGCGRNTILRRLRQVGMSVRSPGEYRKQYRGTRSPRYRQDVLNTTLTKLYLSGLGIAAIAQQVGCHESTVLRRLRRDGIRLRPAGCRLRFETLSIVRLYTDGLTAREIAERLGCSKTTATNRLLRAGIVRR